MTKKGRPNSVVPASRNLAIDGWSMSASACRSASSRAMNWAESIPGLITLSAAVRRTGDDCSARKTTPMPPSPICSTSV